MSILDEFYKRAIKENVYYRIQDLNFDVPEKSSNWFYDNEEYHSGLCVHHVFEHALDDILGYGQSAYAGINYSDSIMDSGGNPVLMVVQGEETPEDYDECTVIELDNVLGYKTKDEIIKIIDNIIKSKQRDSQFDDEDTETIILDEWNDYLQHGKELHFIIEDFGELIEEKILESL